MTALKASEHGVTYRVVRARKRRRCGSAASECLWLIEPGDLYVRAVMFPNHDVYAYVDPVTRKPLRRPIVTPLCTACASAYAVTDELVRAATA